MFDFEAITATPGVRKSISKVLMDNHEQRDVVGPLVEELVSAGVSLDRIRFGRRELVLPSGKKPDVCVFRTDDAASKGLLEHLELVIECKQPKGGDGTGQLSGYLEAIPGRGIPGVFSRSASPLCKAAFMLPKGEEGDFSVKYGSLGAVFEWARNSAQSKLADQGFDSYVEAVSPIDQADAPEGRRETASLREPLLFVVEGRAGLLMEKTAYWLACCHVAGHGVPHPKGVEESGLFWVSLRDLSAGIGFDSNDIAAMQDMLRELSTLLVEVSPNVVVPFLSRLTLFNSAGLGSRGGKILVGFSIHETVLSMCKANTDWLFETSSPQTSFSSKPSMALWRYCVATKLNGGKSAIEVERLAWLMKGSRLERGLNFKSWNGSVLKPSIADIVLKTGLSVSISQVRAGRRIVGFEFEVC